MNRSSSCLRNNSFSVHKNGIELALAFYKEFTFLVQDCTLYLLLECGSIKLTVSVALAIETIQTPYSIARNDLRKYPSGHNPLVMISVPGAGVGYADMAYNYNTV